MEIVVINEMFKNNVENVPTFQNERFAVLILHYLSLHRQAFWRSCIVILPDVIIAMAESHYDVCVKILPTAMPYSTCSIL